MCLHDYLALFWLSGSLSKSFDFASGKRMACSFFFRGFEESKIQLSHRCTGVFGGKLAARSSKRVQGLISGITETLEIFRT